MDSLPIRALDDSPGATANSVKSDDSSPCHDPGRGSPPPNCAICLGRCRNKSFTDSCLHQFCFKCLLTWSKVKAECPLCKQNFRSIIHNVRSNHQYEEYMVEQRHTEELSERIDIDNLTATRRFRYRTTLTLPRQNTLAIQQLLLHHYPMVAELFPGPPAPRRRSPASFRRTVYRYNLWARPLPDFTHRFRDCSPEFYRHNTSQMHRLVPWLNRELHYLLNENVGHIAYVVARILELLPQYSINSTEFRDAMRRYFGDNTEHFLHELYCFASTPYDMNGYDRHVQYTTDNTISTMVNNVLSSSESDASVDSDIVVVSSSAPADLPPGPSRAARPARTPAPVYPQSSITQPAPDGVIPIETISQSDSDDDSSEVMVVGYIKPPQDRTPEVVDLLGSDSDVIVQESSPPQPPAPCEAEGRSAALVKLTLARHDATIASSSESGRTPSQSPPRRPPHHRADADTQVHRVSPSLSLMSSASNFSYFSSSDGYFLSSLSDSEEDAKLRARCFMPRRKPCPERRKRKAKRRARKLRKNNKESNASLNREQQSKHKSHSGVGVKSSKKGAAGEDSTVSVKMDCTQLIDQPGTSGTSRGASEISHGTSATSRGTNEISHGTSETSRGASEISHGTSGTSRGASEISHGTSGASRGTSEISHGTSGTSRGASEISPGTSEMSRVTSEMSRCTTEMSSGTSEMSHGISDMPYGTRAISRSDVSRGTSDESRISSVTSRSTSEISRSTSDGSRGTSNESRGSSGISRSTSRTSRGTSDSSRSTSGISRGTSVISRGMSDVSRGTSGISRNTSDVSRGTSEISRGTSGTSHATKRKLEWSSRRCETTRESKRLKSVVNVVNSQNNFDLASKKSINAERAREAMDSDYEPSDTDQSDSEDDLPLNLSIAKRSRQ